METATDRSSRFVTITLIVTASLTIYIYTLATAQPKYLQPALPAFTFQLGCYALAWLLLASLTANGYLRISDPAVLFLLWLGLYLIYPSIFWLQGDFDKFSSPLKTSRAVALVWFHGLFILGFMAGHLCFRRRWRLVMPQLELDRLPQGWLLYFLPFSVLFLEIVIRLGTSGNLLPLQTRADLSYGAWQDIQAAHAHGGLELFSQQLFYKVACYPVIIQGIGAGLIMVHTLRAKKNLVRNIAILMAGMLFCLLFGSGDRSDAMMPYIIALIFTDILIGPFRYRYLFLLFIVTIVSFEFYGAYRNIRYLPFDQALTIAYDDFMNQTVKEYKVSDFSGMFVKEYIGINIFAKKGIEGINYLIISVARMLPLQILPEKKFMLSTSEALALATYGSRAAMKGRGTAGAMLVDGYRFAGGAGVALLGAIIGALIALIHNWFTQEVRPGLQGPVLMKIVLVSGLYAWSYIFIRHDLTSIFTTFLWQIIFPWFLVFLFISSNSVWRFPLPTAQAVN
jgi:hypothetical protein